MINQLLLKVPVIGGSARSLYGLIVAIVAL